MKTVLEEAIRVLQETLSRQDLQKQFETIVEATRTVLKQGSKILLCGNGGSAAEAQHIAAEFVGRFFKERKPLAALSLTTDTSNLTCITNDYSYDVVFSRQVEALGRKGDILYLLSTSGNSKNCIAAAQKAKELGIKTVALTGATGGLLKAEVDICYCVPSKVTSHIQEVHLVVLHAICEKLDNDTF